MKFKPGLILAVLFLLSLLSYSVFTSSSEARLSNKTVKLIAYYEGWSPCVLDDPAGNASIGYGHLIHLGHATKRDRKRWGCITKREGRALLKKELRYTEQEIHDRIDVRLTEPMWRALISYTYNLALGILIGLLGSIQQQMLPNESTRAITSKRLKKCAFMTELELAKRSSSSPD